MVRIVHILPAFYPGRVHDFELMSSRGGAERYVCELSSAMSERVNTTLIVFGEEDDEFMYNSLSIRIVQSRPFLPRLNGHVNFSSLSLMPIFGSFDVIHAHQYYADTTLLAAFAAKMYRRKFYVTDLGWRGINFSRYIPMKYLCDKILGLTAYDVHRFRVSASKIAIIGGGVDLSKYNYVEDKKRKVVYVGRILPHKGIENLIAAVGNDIECVIAGHALNDRYFNLLKELAIDRKVNFLLSASDAEIRSHIEEAAALVLPSVDVDLYGRGYHNSELFGLVIAEAFVCGTPSIVSDSSALPFVVDHEITGYVVPQNSPSAIRQRILQLFDNQFDAIEMGKRCRAKALRFYSWTEVADRCLANYGIDD